MATGRIEQEIFIKIIGGKDVAAMQKAIKELEKTKAKLVVEADTDEARKELEAIDKQIAELKGEKAEIEVTAKVDRAIDALEDVSVQAKKAEVAAEALSVALGPELAAKADIDSIIIDFQRMGLSLDDITANADRLGSKLQEVGQRDIGGRLTTGFQRVDGAARSAAGSSSVMANAIGNTTQDLFAMGGVAGTAGVALGQMGEYMADAAFSGEQLGTVLRNFGKIAGPVAAITAAIGIFSSIMGSLKAQAAATAEQAKAIGDAMAEGADDALAFTNVLRDNADAMSDYIAITNDPLGNFGVQVDELMSKIPLIGGLFKEAGTDIFDVAERAGLSIYDLSQAIEDGGRVGGEFTKQLLAAAAAGKITDDEYAALSEVITNYGEATLTAAEKLELFNVDQEEANALLTEMLAKRNPLSRYRAQWNILFDDLRDGTIDTQATADAINYLSEQLGILPSEVISIAFDEINKKGPEATDTLEILADAFTQVGDAMREQEQANTDYAISLADAQGALDGLVDGFGILGRKQGAMEAAFALGNAPLEALESVQDVNDAIRELGEFIEDEGVPNIFDPNDVDASPFLAKIEGLRGPIQDAVTNAFATGGPAAAQATADAYVSQIVSSMRGKLTEGEVRTLLGLGDLTATIKVAIDQDALALAQQSLAILVGLRGESPWTATIALQLAAGTITPQTAQALINEQLQGAGVEVPAELGPVANTAKVISDAQRVADRNPVKLTATLTPLRGIFDAGTPSAPYGGIAGERGPEILDDRYLTTGPTYVPPGTKVTSRRQTRVILNSHSGRGLRRYDSGGTVPVTNVKVNVNLPAGADGADVVRQVKRWARRNGSLV